MYIHDHLSIHADIITAIRECANEYEWFPFYWHKPSHIQQSVGPTRYATDVESIICVDHKTAASRPTPMAQLPPHERPNWQSWKTPKRSRFKLGNIFNGSQKPTKISQYFCQTQLGPSHSKTVLVLGSGSGSEIIGALLNGNSVIAVDNDMDQITLSKARVVAALEFHREAVGNLPSTDPLFPKSLLQQDDGRIEKIKAKTIQEMPPPSQEREGPSRASQRPLSQRVPDEQKNFMCCNTKILDMDQAIQCVSCDNLRCKPCVETDMATLGGNCSLACKKKSEDFVPSTQ